MCFIYIQTACKHNSPKRPKAPTEPSAQHFGHSSLEAAEGGRCATFSSTSEIVNDPCALLRLR